MKALKNKSIVTKHFGFFETSNTSWEAISVIAESDDRAWEMLEESEGLSSDDYVIEDLGVKRDQSGYCYAEELTIND